MTRNKIEVSIIKPKPTLSVTLNDVEELKGKNVGDKVVLTISGRIRSIREPYEYEDEKEKKNLRYEIEIDQFGQKVNKRI